MDERYRTVLHSIMEHDNHAVTACLRAPIGGSALPDHDRCGTGLEASSSQSKTVGPWARPRPIQLGADAGTVRPMTAPQPVFQFADCLFVVERDARDRAVLPDECASAVLRLTRPTGGRLVQCVKVAGEVATAAVYRLADLAPDSCSVWIRRPCNMYVVARRGWRRVALVALIARARACGHFVGDCKEVRAEGAGRR